MANPVISWAQDNPLLAGVGAVGIIVIAMMVFGGGGGSDESSGNGAGIGAYYNAVANQAQAGAAVQMAQIQEQGESNRTLIAATYGLERDKVWAPVSMANSANAAATEQQGQKLNYQLGIATLEHQHAIMDNLVNLENSRIASNQNIAFKQANVQNSANKLGFVGNLIGTAVKGATAFATGGASLIGGGAIKGLPTGGAWV